jgi:exopolysaccharide biosynthesis polyprenyl glycosylphosphotransferase
MTQTTIRTIPLDGAPLVPTVPRPRGTEPQPPSDATPTATGPGPVADQTAAQITDQITDQFTDLAPAVPAADLGRRRAQRTWSVVGVDLVLALAVAATTGLALETLELELAVAAATAWPLLLLAAGHYRRRSLGETRTRRAWSAAWTGIRTCVIVLALAPWLGATAGPLDDPLMLAQLVAVFAATSGAHALLVRQGHRPRLVLAGRPRDVREAVLELEAADRHEVVAACLTRPSKVPLGDLPTYVGLVAAAEVAHGHHADAVVVLPGARLGAAEVRRLHWAVAAVGADLCVGTGLIDVAPGRARVLASGGLNLVHVVPAALRGPRRWVKEVVERVSATLGAVLLLPLMLTVALLVRLDSPGPAIYRQQRVGRDGRLFTMYKFRSMSTTADDERTHLVACNEADGVLFKIQHDPRITRVGRWLRRTSLDELPQLLNVVRGEMSLVGPRPALPDEVARYDVDPRRRLVVKPGMTGLWQVSGRSDLSWAESVRLDVRYVDNWSLGLDLAIMVRTLRAVVSRRGAY